VTTFYLDTSACFKLVITEDDSAALRSWIDEGSPRFVASDLLRVETLRACRRQSTQAIVRAREVLESITLIPITTTLSQAAAHVDPLDLRSLDAIHLATALALGDDISGILTYDSRLAQGAEAHGLRVITPSA
jgi:uncharacterized protein